MSWTRSPLLATALWLLSPFAAEAAAGAAPLAPPAPAAAPAEAEHRAADWIADSCRAEGGALTVHPRGKTVSGYFGNITASGLAAVGLHLDVVRDWMAWYVAHAHGSGSGVDGVPDDATVLTGGGLRSRGRPDSTDAYGATFMSLALAAYQTDDPALRMFIAEHRDAMRTIALSAVATQQPNGLTWSRPQHAIEYAIDNEQVYRGMLDGAALMERAYHDTALAQTLRADAAATLRGMQISLWDERTQAFRPYVGISGRGPAPDLARLYPDALAQVLAIVYGVVDPASPRAASLLARSASSLVPQSEGDVLEFTYAVALAKDRMGGDAGGALSFVEPPLCVDAGWFLQAKHAWAGGHAK
ncbi:MAG: hypothetical protein KGM44_07580 [bacterium]|nr:hypothetical protein [bacterium]